MFRYTISFLTLIAGLGYFQISPVLAWSWPWSKGSISGIVVNDTNLSEYVDGVGIRIEESGDFITTNSFGEFKIQNLSPRTYTLSTRKSGFMAQRLIVTVKANEITTVDIRLKPDRPIYNSATWAKKASEKLHGLLNKWHIQNQRIAIAFYKKSDIEHVELPEMVLRFSAAFNAHLGKNQNTIVVRDLHQANYLISELRSHHQFKVDFDPATVARIGKKLGASIVIIGALLEKREYFEPLINGTSVEKQAYIPGLSMDDILLQKGL